MQRTLPDRLSVTVRALLSVTLVFAVVSFAADVSAGSDPSEAVVREPLLAGTWYPAESGELRSRVNRFLDRAEVPDQAGRLVALIAPHAGYDYSGPVAAHAFKLLENRRFDTVVVVAPSHRARFSGVSVYDQGGYRTPLGVVEPDREIIERLKQEAPALIRYREQAHRREHSLEIELPFLQTVLEDFRLVPLVMGDQDRITCNRLADALVSAIDGGRTLLVASSDLSHFHDSGRARELDEVVLHRIRTFDPFGLSLDLAMGRCEACGGGPMVAVMQAARRLGADTGRVLRYADSGDATGDHSRVVGYVAAAFWDSEHPEAGSGEEKEMKPQTPRLDRVARKTLHWIARRSIEARCRGEEAPESGEVPAVLREPRGAFVSLHRNGSLRGCIGRVIAVEPLVEAVCKMSQAAAFEDPRFPPLQTGELEELEIEISVLSPFQRIDDPRQVEVGVHGLYLRSGGRAGLLLPQVASKRGWDRETFLEQTCRKAGLPGDAWRRPHTELYVFTAEVF